MEPELASILAVQTGGSSGWATYAAFLLPRSRRGARCCVSFRHFGKLTCPEMWGLFRDRQRQSLGGGEGGRGGRGWEGDGKDQPEVRCEKIDYASSRTSHVQAGVPYCCAVAILHAWRTQDPRQRSKPDQGPYQPASQGAAAGPKWRHCLPKRKAHGESPNTPTGKHYGDATCHHMQSDNELLNLVFREPIHQAHITTQLYSRHRSEQSRWGSPLGILCPRPCLRPAAAGRPARLSRLLDH